MQPLTDSEWRAQSDAKTLVEANEIISDRQRLSSAKQAALKLLDEAKNLQKIVNGKNQINSGGAKSTYTSPKSGSSKTVNIKQLFGPRR